VSSGTLNLAQPTNHGLPIQRQSLIEVVSRHGVGQLCWCRERSTWTATSAWTGICTDTQM